MVLLVRGKYRARLAAGDADLARAQALRHRRFIARRGTTEADGRDSDRFDAMCQHVLVEDTASGQLVCCYRLLSFAAGESLDNSYASQVYGLAALDGFAGAKLELGRFCLDPDWHDPDILRLAWGAMAQIVDAQAVTLLFGCSSFEGADWLPHAKALALLRGHLAPAAWLPEEKAAEVFRFSQDLGDMGYDLRAALQGLPPLLRTYLAMAGWVSDHAVIDRELDTLHVFTAVEIARIPSARARALRAISE
ncbi:ornithine-acyl-ACP acyltransferase [Cypionkella aquatica]|uniref:L-ornithine N(alpha)-acyltransferase n=1 Tax=Cypionkella aquatica TaxID=1756042 RepID=A0AA37TSK0_9RHOB|nr:GNAT family N-acetyltransferase [Cypionkella aquatica]GLS85043.1 ornithine-acyl-ACP acyltransferase [Cypionkella aquatica]